VSGAVLQGEHRNECERDGAHDYWKDDDYDEQFDESEAVVGLTRPVSHQLNFRAQGNPLRRRNFIPALAVDVHPLSTSTPTLNDIKSSFRMVLLLVTRPIIPIEFGFALQKLAFTALLPALRRGRKSSSPSFDPRD
jgi:hypothetical protein